jgi:hypothetical protein
MLGIHHNKTLAYNHKANRVERTHRIVGDMLRTILKETEIGEWDAHLSLLQMYMRSQPSGNYPFAPAEIFFGRNIRTPPKSQIEAFERETKTDLPEYVKELVQRVKMVIEAQKICREINNQKTKELYNEKAKPIKIELHSMVYLRNDAKKPGISQKLQKEFLGPYKVLEITSNHSLRLWDTVTKKTLKNLVHIDRVKPMIQRTEEGERNEEVERQQKVPKRNPKPVVKQIVGERPQLKHDSAIVEKHVVRETPELKHEPELGIGEISREAPKQQLKTTSRTRSKPKPKTSPETESGIDEQVDWEVKVASKPNMQDESQSEGDDSQQWEDSVPESDKPTDNVFLVERLLKVKGTGANRMYLVRWKKTGDRKEKDSWIPMKDISDYAIQKFHEKKTQSGKTRMIYRRKK